MRKRLVCGVVAGVVMTAAGWAQTAAQRDGKMAPLSAYQMDRESEIALARTAAPKSISGDAEVLVMGAHGYEIAAKGTNGFVCLVERAWTKKVDDADFWSPKIRAPFCLNAAAARSYLPITELKTKLALEGRTNREIGAGVSAAFDQGRLPAIERGAMCYMMSKQGELGGTTGPWHPHVMIFSAMEKPESWGANLAGSPVMGDEVSGDRYTVFLVPVGRWSDGTVDGGH